MVESGGQVATLMIIFGIGYLAVFGLFVLLYRHAYQNRERLELNELEGFDTRTDIRENTLNAGIAAVSVVFATFGGSRYGPLSGMIYMLTTIIMSVHGFLNGMRRKQFALFLRQKPPSEPDRKRERTSIVGIALQGASYAMRVLEGHKLITLGPYNVVRNPIYTGMFGMLMATGLAISHGLDC